MRHLSEEELLDLAEGNRLESATPHLAACASCRQQVAELRGLMATLDVEVPEPSPMFWDHMSARVRQEVAAQGRAPAAGAWRWARAWTWTMAAGVAMVAMAITVAWRMPIRPASSVSNSEVVVTPSSPPVNASGADPSLGLLADLAAELDWESAADASIAMPVGAADGAIVDLTDVERVELRRLLHEVMAVPGA